MLFLNVNGDEVDRAKGEWTWDEGGECKGKGQVSSGCLCEDGGKGRAESWKKSCQEKLCKTLKNGKKDCWVFCGRLGIIQSKLPGCPHLSWSQGYLITVRWRKRSHGGAQDTLFQSMAPWSIERLSLQESEKLQKQEDVSDTSFRTPTPSLLPWTHRTVLWEGLFPSPEERVNPISKMEERLGWHPRLNGRESEQTLGDGEGHGSLMCCRPRGRSYWAANCSLIPFVPQSFSATVHALADHAGKRSGLTSSLVLHFLMKTLVSDKTEINSHAFLLFILIFSLSQGHLRVSRKMFFLSHKYK